MAPNHHAPIDIRIQLHFFLTTVAAALEVLGEDEYPTFTRVNLLGRVLILLGLVWLQPQPQQEQPESNTTKMTSSILQFSMALAYLASVAFCFYKMPFCFESDLWSAQTDAVVAVFLLVRAAQSNDNVDGNSNHHHNDSKPSVPVDHLSATLLAMYGCFYTAAGFFKLNSHFLDPDASCATIFATLHLHYYAGPWLPSTDHLVAMAAAIKPWAPLATLAVELVMGLGLTLGVQEWFHQRQWILYRIGLPAILYFHGAVCATPRPVDISFFAVQCAARLCVAHTPAAWERAYTTWWRPHGVLLIGVVAAWVAFGIQTEFTFNNWSYAAYVFILALHQTALWCRTQPQFMTVDTKAPIATMEWLPNSWSWSTRLAVLWAFWYSFGMIVTGLMEEASPNMFANLQTHGGSNHLLVPTGILLRREGPEIRVEATTSAWLTTTYPADLTHTLQGGSAVTSVLDAIGNPAPSFFNGGANRVLGLFRKGWLPHSGTFVPYTVPGLEFQRLVWEAIREDGTFRVTYAHLPEEGDDPQTTTDEQWRGTAVARRIHAEVTHGTVTECRVEIFAKKEENSPTNSSCDPSTDLIYDRFLQETPWWRRKLSMYHGYPILYEPDGTTVRPSITCFGP